jgi:hypothetical protein
VEFLVFIGLPASIDPTGAFAFWFEVPRPLTGFEAMAYPFDPDPFAENPTAIGSIYGFDENDDPNLELYATNGSITFSSITTTGSLPAGQNNGDVFAGKVARTVFKEIDAAGDPVADGCTTTLAGLSFNLKQNMDVSGFAPSGFAPSKTPNWSVRARHVKDLRAKNLRATEQ